MDFLSFLRRNFLITIVLVFGLALFLYKIESIPAGVAVDEAVVGYDALSISTTLRDHFGQFLPINFKFFNSFTPGLYVYVEAIFIKLLGFGTFSLRLPSAISILILSILLYKFLKHEKLTGNRFSLPLGVFFFVITPWTIFNARLGYETTFAFALLSAGILYYKNPLLSFTLLSLSIYAGHTQRYLAPLIILGIIFIFYRSKKNLKALIVPLVVFLVLQIPNFILVSSPSFWVKNSALQPGMFIEHYLSYFSPTNLFYREDYHLQRSAPMISVFYGWMFIPWIIGIYQLYKNRRLKIYQYLSFLILTIPIPAALANVNYSTQRALPLLLPYTILIIIGTDRILNKLKPAISIFIVLAVTFMSLILVWRSYFVLFPVERASSWDYGYQELSQLIKDNPNKHFVIDNSRIPSYIEILYWLKYSPVILRQDNPPLKNYYQDPTQNPTLVIRRIETRSIVWKTDPCMDQIIAGDSLTISSGQAEEHKLSNIFKVLGNRQQIILEAYQTNPLLKCGKR